MAFLGTDQRPGGKSCGKFKHRSFLPLILGNLSPALQARQTGSCARAVRSRASNKLRHRRVAMGEIGLRHGDPRPQSRPASAFLDHRFVGLRDQGGSRPRPRLRGKRPGFRPGRPGPPPASRASGWPPDRHPRSGTRSGDKWMRAVPVSARWQGQPIAVLPRKVVAQDPPFSPLDRNGPWYRARRIMWKAPST